MSGRASTVDDDTLWVAQRHPVVEHVRETVEPLLATEGFQLVDIEYTAGGSALLRLFVDRAGRSALDESPGAGVSIAELAELTPLLSDAIDVADPISGAYRLEVSSPGLDRPLVRRRDFIAAQGRPVLVKTAEKVGDRRRFRGELVRVETGEIVVSVDGQEYAIGVDRIAKARLEYQPARR